MGLVALGQVESSQTSDRTHVPCMGKWILQCTIREVIISNLKVLPLPFILLQPRFWKGIRVLLLKLGETMPNKYLFLLLIRDILKYRVSCY